MATRAASCPSTAPSQKSGCDSRHLPPPGCPLAKCTGQVASCLCQDSAAAPAIIPLLSRLKLGEVGPGDTQQSAHPRLDTSLHKHLCNFTNQLSSSLFFTNLTILGKDEHMIFPVGTEAMPCSSSSFAGL